MSLYKTAQVCIILILASGCGFQPIFGTGKKSIIIKEMQHIEILPIENRIGQRLRNHLEYAITPLGRAFPTKYFLKVSLTENKQSLAIKKSKIATRANLNFRANFVLTRKSSGELLAQGSSRMTTKYNMLTETFATLMAEKDARKRAVREISEDISRKIAVFFKLSDKSIMDEN